MLKCTKTNCCHLKTACVKNVMAAHANVTLYKNYTAISFTVHSYSSRNNIDVITQFGNNHRIYLQSFYLFF